MNLRRLVPALLLTCVLCLSAFAGETQTPPCAPPEPGQTSTPPCSGGQMTGDNSVVVSTPSDSEYLVAEVAISLFESLLPLY
jgi:hypothetical protein